MMEIDISVIEKNKKIIEKLQNKETLLDYRFAGIILGSAVSQGFTNTGESKSSISANTVIGVNYENAITRKFKLITNILYYNKTNLNSKIAVVFIDYDFGVFKEEITIKSDKLQFLEIPILLEYAINEKHFIAFGGSFSYLLNANSTVFTKKTDYFNNTTEEKLEKLGYVNGFEKVDYAVLISYQCALTNRLKAILRFNYGFKDMTKNDYFNNNMNDKNMNIKFLISYNLY